MNAETKERQALVKKGRILLLILCVLWTLANLLAKVHFRAMDFTFAITSVGWILLMLFLPSVTGWLLLAGTAVSVVSLFLPGGSGSFSPVNVTMWVLGAGIAVIIIRSPAIQACSKRKQLVTKLLGITGPTGAGKTTALQALKELGVTIIDADEVYHELLEQNVKLKEALTKRFGDMLLDETGQVNRKKLGERVFGDPEALEELNRITHKFVGEEIDRRVISARVQGRSCAIDAIALIESGLAGGCDATVAVLAPEEVRIRRIMAREGISEEYARKRVSAQKDEGFFRANCAYILENTGEDTPETFLPRARALFEQILKP